MNYDYDASYLDSPDLADAEAWPDYGDYGEARKKTPPSVKGASGASTYKKPPPSGGGGSVTQAQLEAALARVREQITANATAIKTIDGRVRTVISDTQKLQAMSKKDVDKLRADLRNTQTLSALIPLLANGTPYENVAPLLHLVNSDVLGTSGQSSSSSSSGSILGNNSNLIAIGALLYAANVFPHH